MEIVKNVGCGRYDCGSLSYMFLGLILHTQVYDSASAHADSARSKIAKTPSLFKSHASKCCTRRNDQSSCGPLRVVVDTGSSVWARTSV